MPLRRAVVAVLSIGLSAGLSAGLSVGLAVLAAPTAGATTSPTAGPVVPRASRVTAPASGCLVTGDLAVRYRELGARASVLGPCTGNEVPVARGGSAQTFTGGSLYRSPATGAHVVRGAIRGRYAALGWENSTLGFPTTDEFEVRGGRGQHFQGGSVYWSPATGAHDVSGPVREVWAGRGWENSSLGFPVTDELTLPLQDGRVQHFEGGAVYRSATTGAVVVGGAVQAAWAATGYEGGPLGYPTGEEHEVPGGRRGEFQRGSITWDAATGRTSVALLPRLAVLGDSITHGACGGGAQSAPARVRVTTTACFGWPGATSDEMQAFVQDQRFRSAWPAMPLPMATVDLRRAIADSDVLVVGLGTNDALRDRAPFPAGRWPAGDTAPVPSGHVPVENGYFDQKIDFFLRAADGRPVYWYDLALRGADPATRAFFERRNERLAAATRRWPNLHVLAWSATVAAHPDLLVDEVHPGEAGRAARWALLTAELPAELPAR
ncbi:GDSL-type esterase/lipase family protein [Kineococcus sp. LSe6-4]|uniref:GDSL-type esterase/lipase family protein n=1 Tax=Kineococcus halophytocola TaxID=3234027 RepID=A0ABV4H1X9_9ACTN